MTDERSTENHVPNTSSGWSDVTIQVVVMLSLLVMMIVTTSFVDPNFLTPGSLRSVLRDTAIWSLFALGQAVVIIAGGIDLSVGSMICFLGVVATLLLNSPVVNSLMLMLFSVIALAAAVGAIHGILVCLARLQPFLVTLCSLLIFRGLARVITNDKTVSYSSEHELFEFLGSGAWLGIPIPVFILIAALCPLAIFMHWTVPGRYLYAIGFNVDAARFSGVRVNLLRTVSYVLCAIMTALAAMLEASHVVSVTPSNAGLAYEMYGITGAVLGGCALRGGRGSLLGVVIGMAILRVIKSAVIFLGINTYWTFTVTGMVLLTAVLIDSLVRHQRRQS